MTTLETKIKPLWSTLCVCQHLLMHTTTTYLQTRREWMNAAFRVHCVPHPPLCGHKVITSKQMRNQADVYFFPCIHNILPHETDTKGKLTADRCSTGRERSSR